MNPATTPPAASATPSTAAQILHTRAQALARPPHPPRRQAP